MKTNRRLTEKRLREYGFLQPAFINGKILEPTTDLNGFSLMKRKISYNREYVGLTLPIGLFYLKKSTTIKKSECLTLRRQLPYEVKCTSVKSHAKILIDSLTL